MSGTRRARLLVSGISESLEAALALADRLDEQAGRIETGEVPLAAPRIIDAEETDQAADLVGDVEGVGLALSEAGALARRQAPAFAGAGWEAPAWANAPSDGSADPPIGPDGRPGLWRVGRILVPPVGRGGVPVEVPLALPLLDAGNLQIETTRARRGEAVGLVRSLLTRILASAPPGAVRVTVYDPHELGAGLAAFAPLRLRGVVGPTLTSRARLELALAELSGEVGRITVDRLAGRFDSLREREDAGLPRSEPWRLLVLLGWPSLPDEAARALDAVASQGPSCGVHVIAVIEPGAGAGGAGTGGGAGGPGAIGAGGWAGTETAGGAAGAGGGWGAGGGAGRVWGVLPRAETITAAELLGVAADPVAGSTAPASWRTSMSGTLGCVLDDPPPPPLVSAVTNRVAAGVARAAASAPDLGGLLPAGLWEYESSAGISVPVAHGADGPVVLTFDDDTVHGLVGGQAGAGKSTLLLDIVYGLAARYGPDQLRFHLLDFKEGLEFAQFAQRPGDPFFLPQADTVGIESDREFGVAVLRAARDEMQRRSVTMRAVGARDLRGLRAADRSSAWPRIMIVIDEFQVMLTPLDTVAREAVSLLEVLARQGRAYGIHLLLASQTLSGIDALDATAGKRGSIFGQFALRVALRTSISESRVLLSTANEAAGALSGVGEAIVNRRNGHPIGNEHVRVAYPDPRVVAGLRDQVSALVSRAVPAMRPPRVFVGHAPAVLADNPAFQALAGWPVPASGDPGAHGAVGLRGAPDEFGAAGGHEVPGAAGDPLAFVGVPLDLAPPAVGVRLARLPGRHLAVLGPLRREAVGMLQAAAVSVGAQTAGGGLAVDVVAADPATVSAAEAMAEALRLAGHPTYVTDVTGLRAVLASAAAEIRAREEAALAGQAGAATAMRLVVVFAVDAGRAGLEARDEASRRSGLDDLRTVTRRGPAVGVHLLGWWRAPSRLVDDLGPGHRDDIAAWVATGLPGGDLFGLAGHRPVTAGTTPNRAVLFDRHVQADPRTVVPFAPLAAGSAADNGVAV
ncbi:cell division protein FtsK [Parafrankia colletiae]|uniref:Cell division protein FtsK n=1 Tax=Parafrankia colletiae TaxID=573497 RepID=A0A1S1R482_9ACTN|nr:FtsK/SpoIIIE domain-containing protein [Parafrankia colletiae]OHV39544.1 cell division protein FtsK [Parafrankia colletiae]